jgi:hypothetical protein
MNDRRLAIGITLAALTAAVLHLTFPGIAVDNVTVALAVVAALPWFARILQSLTLPGGVKLEFRELTKRVEALDDKLTKLQEFVVQGVGAKQRAELSAHLALLKGYVSGFGARVPDPPIVYVEGTSMASCYDPTNREIVVQREFAHSLDVVAREYMHSVLSSAATGAAQDAWDFEVVGLESGLADYFVASQKGEAVLYDGTRLRPIHLANERRFTDDFSTDDAGNDLGEIWCGAFWRVRDLLGRKAADAALWTAWDSDAVAAASRQGTARIEFVRALCAVITARRSADSAAQVADVFAVRGAPR